MSRSLTRLHTHPCSACSTPVECCGHLEDNYDGWPAVVCSEYHIRQMDTLCEDCAEAAAKQYELDLQENV